MQSLIARASRPTRPKKLLQANFTLHKTFASSSIMSNSSKEWLVQIPDKPNALQSRLGARPTHLKNLQPRIDSGQVVFGGAVVSKHPAEGEIPDMTGSVMLIKADTEEEVLEFVKNDEYTKQGVWDVAQVKISPFRCAVRTAM